MGAQGQQPPLLFQQRVRRLGGEADQGDRKADLDKYLKLAQELLFKEVPQIPILVTKETIGYSKKLKGVINSPLELTYFDQKTTLEK